jgi:hypothetical protein
LRLVLGVRLERLISLGQFVLILGLGLKLGQLRLGLFVLRLGLELIGVGSRLGPFVMMLPFF